MYLSKEAAVFLMSYRELIITCCKCAFHPNPVTSVSFVLVIPLNCVARDLIPYLSHRRSLSRQGVGRKRSVLLSRLRDLCAPRRADTYRD
jgi:hypothetical protein